jgi:phosphatidylinositol-3-phosphatase
VLSPFAKGGGYVSHTQYYHSSMLRTVQEIFGITPLIRDAANRPNLSDLFNQYP